jgi:hypothetical protein
MFRRRRGKKNADAADGGFDNPYEKGGQAEVNSAEDPHFADGNDPMGPPGNSGEFGSSDPDLEDLAPPSDAFSNNQEDDASGSLGDSYGTDSRSGADDDITGDSGSLLGVDNFRDEDVASPPHSPRNVDDSPYRDGGGDNLFAVNEGVGDLPHADDHRAATGSSRHVEADRRNRKVALSILCLFVVGVGAGIAVVFLLRANDDDSPSPRIVPSTPAPTGAPATSAPSPPPVPNIFDTGAPTTAPTSFNESNFTLVPTLAPSFANSTLGPNETFAPTLSPSFSNATLGPNETFAPTLPPTFLNETLGANETFAPTLSPNFLNETLGANETFAPTLSPTFLNATLGTNETNVNGTSTAAPTPSLNATESVPVLARTLAPTLVSDNMTTTDLPTLAPVAVNVSSPAPTLGRNSITYLDLGRE